VSGHTPLIIDIDCVMIRIGLILEKTVRCYRSGIRGYGRPGGCKHTDFEVALARHQNFFMADTMSGLETYYRAEKHIETRRHAAAKPPRARFMGENNARGNTLTEGTLAGKNKVTPRTLLSDQRGAVAFEMLTVWLFLMMSLLLPLADVAIAGFQFVSAWGALRAFGQYVQLHPPPDVTDTSSWTSTLPTPVAGYPISNVKVLCGDTNAGAVCSSANVALPTKYYSYTTTVTLNPMVLRSVLCSANPCSFTLPYSERFQ
jgi:hypothetical protein